MDKKKFEFETVIRDETNLCNMEIEKKKIMGLILDGKKVLFYGRRNTGKTSLIEASIIPRWHKKKKSGLYITIDLYGVRNLSHISERVARGFSEGFSRSFKSKNVLQSTLKLIASLRPKLTLDNNGKPQIELGVSGSEPPHFKKIFKKINDLHSKKIPTLIIIDEFQDIACIEEAEGLIRDSLQRLDEIIPVIILGSKKHLLRKIFSVPNAPLYNWGEGVEVSTIDYKDYHEFMKERGLNISLETSTYLQNRMKRIPEPINIVCYHLQKNSPANKKITGKTVDETINELVQNRRGRPQELLSTLTANQARFLEVLSKHNKIRKITSKAVQKESDLTSPGILKVVSILEDNGIIYKGEDGYEIADPFLDLHIKRYGI